MARFPFTSIGSDPKTLMPRLPLEIAFGARSIQLSGIVDSGASVSVLPYQIGLDLGAIWEEQAGAGPLVSGLGGVMSRALRVNARIPELTGERGVPLVFAWADTDLLPVLLGQTNFLMEFNVCLYRSRNTFEVWRR